MEQVSRSYLQKLVKDGAVLVNGKPVKSSYKVENGDRIRLEIPDAVEPEIEAEPMALDILYEDSDIILINKMCIRDRLRGRGYQRDDCYSGKSQCEI